MDFNKYLILNTKLTINVWLHEDDDEPQSFESHIKDLDSQNRRILIDSPPLSREDIRSAMISGTLIGLDFINNYGHITLYPIIDGIEHRGLKGYWLSIPENIEHRIERLRSHARVPYHKNIEIEPLDPKTEEPQPLIRCMGQNLSGGGLRFSGPQLFAKGSDVILHLALAEGVLKLRMTIIDSFENESRFSHGQDSYISTGFFKELHHQEETKIINECFRLELERESREKRG